VAIDKIGNLHYEDLYIEKCIKSNFALSISTGVATLQSLAPRIRVTIRQQFQLQLCNAYQQQSEVMHIPNTLLR
jgi:hypothetical protein|tara:strand:- start:446 stop:667 length:222 start_codon:yes stop_codon:yes gene_type:complete